MLRDTAFPHIHLSEGNNPSDFSVTHQSTPWSDLSIASQGNYTVEADGSNPGQLTQNISVLEFNPSWVDAMFPQLAIASVVIVGGWHLLRRRFVHVGVRTWEAGRRKERELYLASDRYKVSVAAGLSLSSGWRRPLQGILTINFGIPVCPRRPMGGKQWQIVYSVHILTLLLSSSSNCSVC